MSNGLPQATVDSLLEMAKGPPSWYPITTQKEWQDCFQDRNWDMASVIREMFQNRCWSPRTLGDYLEVPEWAIMALVGMPTDRWWHMKREYEAQWAGLELP